MATVSGIAQGGSVQAPSVPERAGYTFAGWDKSFDNVTSDMVVTAQYAIVENQLYFSFKDNGDGTTTMTLSVKGDVYFCGMEGKLAIAAEGMQYAAVKSLSNLLTVNATTEYIMFIYEGNGYDLTEEIDLLQVTFTNTADKQSAVVTVSGIEIFDANLDDCNYSIAGQKYN